VQCAQGNCEWIDFASRNDDEINCLRSKCMISKGVEFNNLYTAHAPRKIIINLPL